MFIIVYVFYCTIHTWNPHQPATAKQRQLSSPPRAKVYSATYHISYPMRTQWTCFSSLSDFHKSSLSRKQSNGLLLHVEHYSINGCPKFLTLLYKYILLSFSLMADTLRMVSSIEQSSTKIISQLVHVCACTLRMVSSTNRPQLYEGMIDTKSFFYTI